MKPLKHTVMNNISRIFILVAAALPFALPCSGQKPEPLTIFKTVAVPGMTADKMFEQLGAWKPKLAGFESKHPYRYKAKGIMVFSAHADGM